MKFPSKRTAALLAVLLAVLACRPLPDLGTDSPPASVTPAGADPTGAAAAGYPTPVPTDSAPAFVDEENGVRVPLPEGWETFEPDPGDQALVRFSDPGEEIIAYLYVFPAGSDETPESLVDDLSASVLSGLQDVVVVRDEALLRPDGAAAWTREVSADSGGNTLGVGMTAIQHGARFYYLLAFGLQRLYDQRAGEIALMLNGMTFQAPVINGIRRDQALFLSGGESTNPNEYDPATTHGSGDKLLFSGLVSFDPGLNLVPELAASWDISEQGTVYTFHLRENARFHDGRPVTAEDVVYSWERAADPDTGSDTVLTYLGDILGVRERRAGQADSIAGLAALDEHTLRVTIDGPKAYFLFKLTMPVAFVLDRANVESGAEWYRAPNGTGPYRLARWDSFELMIYEANPEFYLGPASIPTIVVELFSGVGIRLYEAGEIDIAGVSTYDVPRLLDPGDPLHADMVSGVSLCTSYVLFDASQPPFDDLRVRQAFSMAFDRRKYIDVVYSGVGVEARGLYPPAMPGYDAALEGLPYDPDEARRLLAESSYGGPAGLPEIVYTTAGIGNSAGAESAALAQMWQQNLGVTIRIENLEPDRYLDLLYGGRHGQLFSSGWCADYPDPENFADVLFHTGAEQNLGNYSSPELDGILDRARSERDPADRLALYQQAERLLVADAPALFIVHGISYALVRPTVRGYVLTPITIPIERYLWLEP